MNVSFGTGLPGLSRTKSTGSFTFHLLSVVGCASGSVSVDVWQEFLECVTDGAGATATSDHSPPGSDANLLSPSQVGR